MLRITQQQSLTPKHSGNLGVATKEPRKGRPAATGRELLRLVKFFHFSRMPSSACTAHNDHVFGQQCHHR